MAGARAVGFCSGILLAPPNPKLFRLTQALKQRKPPVTLRPSRGVTAIVGRVLIVGSHILLAQLREPPSSEARFGGGFLVGDSISKALGLDKGWTLEVTFNFRISLVDGHWAWGPPTHYRWARQATLPY